MGHLRLSIAGLMGLVALVAVEVAGLRSAEDGWVDVCRLLTATALVFATFLARDRRDEEAAFWFGFAVLGWASFVLVLDALTARRSSESIISLLPRFVLQAIVDRTTTNSYAGSLRVMRQFHILHLMLIMPAGFLGGVLYWSVDRRRQRRADVGTSRAVYVCVTHNPACWNQPRMS
jgi:hypothetical protein